MSNEKGITLVEVVVILAVAAAMLAAAAVVALPWLNRETMRSAVYDVQTYMQLARIEAISRNRPCRFVVDTTTGQLGVLDSMGTPADLADDEVLYTTTLSDRVTFDRPGGGAAVTLEQIPATTIFQATFASDGTVDSGVGEVVLFGGERFARISVYGAGGTEVAKWLNGAWHVGT